MTEAEKSRQGTYQHTLATGTPLPTTIKHPLTESRELKWKTHTIFGKTGRVAVTTAVAHRFNGRVLIAERLHTAMLAPCSGEGARKCFVAMYANI